MITEKLLEFMKKKDEDLRGKTDENTFLLTELLECPKKREFRRIIGYIEKTNPALILGSIIHEGLEEILKRVLKPGMLLVEVEHEFQLGNIKILAKPDIMTEDYIVEIKYMRSIGGSLPLPHHWEQLQAYLALFEREKGYIVYITSDGLKEYEVEREWTIDNIYTVLNYKKTPRYDWECRYCSFAPFCPYNVEHQGGKKR